MAFIIPSLGDLVERCRRAFRSNLPGSDAWLWPNNLNPTAKVVGGMTHEVMGFADYIAKQKFALTADSESLDLHGEEFGMARRPAAPARGSIVVSSAGNITVAPSAVFRRADGIEYRAAAGGSLIGGGDLTIEAVAAGDGAGTNALEATPLEIVSGVVSSVPSDLLAEVGANGIIGGTEIEDDESFRARILFRKRYPPHGGNASDYVMWASSVSGVTRVFVERLWAGVGTVRVFPLMDDLFPNGIAAPGDISRVRQVIEQNRPTGALVTVTAPDPVPVDIVIDGLAPDTTAVREAVLTELRATFRRLSRVAGTDAEIGGMPFLAYEAAFSRSWIWQAVANATGEERHIITTPSADVDLSPGQIATLGDVTFT